MTSLLDGLRCDLPLLRDRGLHYGDGLFETVALIDGTPLFFSRHMARMAHGAEVLGIPFPSPDLWREEVRQVCDERVRRQVVKLLLTRGVGGRGYGPSTEPVPVRMVQCHPWPESVAHKRTEGVRLCFASVPLPCGHPLYTLKSLNRLPQVLAARELADGCDEAVLCDGQGQVREAIAGNLFWLLDGKMETPDLADGGVPGIMRGAVLEILAEWGHTVSFVRRRPGALRNMDECFVTNSVQGVVPVRALVFSSERKPEHGGAADWECVPGHMTLRLQQALEHSLGL